MMDNKFKFLLGVIFGFLAVVLIAIDGGGSWLQLAAFTPCIGTLGDSITQDCENPRISGYENVALIFNRSDIDWTSITTDASNPRIVKTMAMLSGKTPFVIYNPRVNPLPFNGSSSTFEQDTDRYTKQVQFYFEGIGGAAAQNVVEPLKSGQFIILLQRKDHRGDGSFQLVGFQSGLTATAQVQDEDTGYWLMTMETSEPSAEVAFFNTDYATTKAAFDALLAAVV